MDIQGIMDSKLKIIALIEQALSTGKITEDDLRLILARRQTTPAQTSNKPHARLSAVDIMFYIAGIVLFAAIIALINQLWDDGIVVRILLSIGIGVSFWGTAFYLLAASRQSDIERGLINALLLTGSLTMTAGGFIVANEFVSYSRDFQFYATAATLAVVGMVHIGFGWRIKRDLITLIGTLFVVMAFPSFMFGLLSGTDVSTVVNCLIVAISGGLLAYATRVVSWTGISSAQAGRAFDSLGAFIALMSLYIASYDKTTGGIWLLVLIASIIGLFYLSIILQDKLMLGNGSLFLVITIITISIRYFSGYGIPISLLVSAVGLLGTAIVATTINRRYIK